jgi:thiamine pyrophosphokinase
LPHGTNDDAPVGSGRAVVFVGGPREPRPAFDAIDADDALVVAADSGVALADQLGVAIDVLVGDMDSADPARVEAARAAGVAIEAHPSAKDATDLELALDAAVTRGGRAITVVAGFGGRVDHQLAVLLALGAPRYRHACIDGFIGDARVAVLHAGTASSERVLRASPGALLTLLPLHGDALGVVATDLQYPLRSETLVAGSTRGVSNVFLEPAATVSLERGTLIAVISEAS